MKKITFLMALLVVLSCGVAGCNKENEKNDSSAEASVNESSNVETSDTSSVSQNEIQAGPCAEAKSLLSEGKFKDAYAVLYAARDDEECAEMLKDFQVVYTQEKSITSVSFGAIDYTGEEITKYTYDSEGRKIKEEYSDSDGYTETQEWVYDENGNIIKDIYSDSDGYSETTENTYNSEGLLVKSVYSDGKGYSDTQEMVYDDDGNIIKDIYSDSDGYSNITENTYNSEGLIIKEEYTEFSDGEESYTYTNEYFYNDAGLLVKEIYNDSYDSNGVIEYEYNEQGVLIKETIGNAYGDIDNETFYNDNGDVLKEIGYIDGEVNYTKENTYDANGNLLKSVEDMGEEYGISISEYTYDSEGRVLTEKNGYADNASEEYIYSESFEYTYNEQGDIIKEVSISEEMTLATEYIFDSEGRVIKAIFNISVETPLFGLPDEAIIDYTYDEYGNPLKETTQADGKVVSTVEFSGYEYFYCPVE